MPTREEISEYMVSIASEYYDFVKGMTNFEALATQAYFHFNNNCPDLDEIPDIYYQIAEETA